MKRREWFVSGRRRAFRAVSAAVVAGSAIALSVGFVWADTPVFDTPRDGDTFSACVGQKFELKVEAHDRDARHEVTLSLLLAPLGGALSCTQNPGNPATCTFVWTPAAGDFGNTNSIVFEATDGTNATKIKVNVRVDCRDLIHLDIHPQSCPNPLNLKSKGVTPVALLGTRDFDVSTVSGVTLMGVKPSSIAFEDVSQPVPDSRDECACTTAGPDGYTDMVLKFDTEALAKAIKAQDGDVVCLTLTGKTPTEAFKVCDCVKIILKGGKGTLDDKDDVPEEEEGGKAPERALNVKMGPGGAGQIVYSAPAGGLTRLTVHDVSGRTVERILDAWMPAGRHEFSWDSARLPSGIYFLRATSGGRVTSQRFVVIK